MSIAARSPSSTLKTLRGRKLSGAASSRRRMLQLGKSSANKVAHRGDRRRAKPPLVSNGLCARFAHLEPCRVLANRRQTKCNTRRPRRIGERLQHHEVSCSLRRAEDQARQWISGRRTPSETSVTLAQIPQICVLVSHDATVAQPSSRRNPASARLRRSPSVQRLSLRAHRHGAHRTRFRGQRLRDRKESCDVARVNVIDIALGSPRQHGQPRG